MMPDPPARTVHGDGQCENNLHRGPVITSASSSYQNHDKKGDAIHIAFFRNIRGMGTLSLSPENNCVKGR